MKIRHLLLAGILGILAAAHAGAQTTIYISGAPAVRQYVTTAINRILTSSTTAGLVKTAISGTTTTTLTTANAVAWFGGNINNIPVTVELSYVGSSAGIQDVAAQTTANFLPTSATASSVAYPEPNTSGNPHQAVIPNFTAADEFQASTPWLGANSLTGASVIYQTLQSDKVGVIPYRWVSNIDAPTTLKNITPQQARLLFESGWIYLSQLTGSNADENTGVYAIGRDIGSGLRTILLSETGIGVQTGIQQYEPTVSTSSNSVSYVASQVLYPAETVNGVALGTGDGGYSSFSGLLAALSAYTNSNGGNLGNTANVNLKGYYLTALADADAQTAIAAGAHEVAWNGNYLGTLGTYGIGANNTGSASYSLSEGTYTFWSYIQLEYLSSQLSGSVNSTAYSFEQALKTDLTNIDSPVFLSDMNVNRTADGQIVYGGNPY